MASTPSEQLLEHQVNNNGQLPELPGTLPPNDYYNRMFPSFNGYDIQMLGNTPIHQASRHQAFDGPGRQQIRRSRSKF